MTPPSEALQAELAENKERLPAPEPLPDRLDRPGEFPGPQSCAFPGVSVDPTSLVEEGVSDLDEMLVLAPNGFPEEFERVPGVLGRGNAVGGKVGHARLVDLVQPIRVLDPGEGERALPAAGRLREQGGDGGLSGDQPRPVRELAAKREAGRDPPRANPDAAKTVRSLAVRRTLGFSKSVT